MKALFTAFFVAGSMIAAPLPVFAGTDVAVVCDDSAPAGWRRPGGYCDSANGMNSLSEPGSEGCTPVQIVGFNANGADRVRVAATDPCCSYAVSYDFQRDQNGRVILAVSPCYDPDCTTMPLQDQDSKVWDRLQLVAC